MWKQVQGHVVKNHTKLLTVGEWGAEGRGKEGCGAGGSIGRRWNGEGRGAERRGRVGLGAGPPLNWVRGLRAPLLLGGGAALRSAAPIGRSQKPAHSKEPRTGRASPRMPHPFPDLQVLLALARGVAGWTRFIVDDPPLGHSLVRRGP